MAPRGLSTDQKRVKLIEIFHETKDFYTLKELEKLGPKLKGIVSQSVKEVLQSLVDDNLVCSDKIGTSNFFWSFPSERGVMLQTKVEKLTTAVATLKQSIEETQQSIAEEKASRQDTPERAAALQRYSELKIELTALQREREQYGASDPVQVAAKRRAVELAKEAAIRHTDNTLSIISYFKNKCGVDPKELRAHLEIPEDWDDI